MIPPADTVTPEVAPAPMVTNVPLSVMVELENPAPVHLGSKLVVKAAAPEMAIVAGKLPEYVKGTIPVLSVKLGKVADPEKEPLNCPDKIADPVKDPEKSPNAVADPLKDPVRLPVKLP